MRVLNPTLYRALERSFQHVRLSCAGEEMIPNYSTDLYGKKRLNMEHGGEYYRVNCPKCGDTRGRLYFHYLWGVKDKYTGTRNLWSMVCYNENCWSDPLQRVSMFDRLNAIAGVLPNARILKGKALTVPEEMPWPGDCIPLHELPGDHKANVYLAGRGYDPERLGRFYDVRYCADSYLFLARERIIAPVLFKGKMVGFQARCTYDMDWKREGAPPKWWTAKGTPRARVFYNGDVAKTFRTGVVVEGPGDVWGFGPMAQAVMGSTVTGYQQKLLVNNFKNGSLVVLLDPEEMKKREKIEKLQIAFKDKFRYGCAFVALPDGTDPGGLDREISRSYVWHEAKKQGVKVSWLRK